MALSGFIKQLLETDTVFGSEAKKATGINDSIVQTYYSDVTASFLINETENTFTLILNNFDTSVSTPQWFIPGKYIKFLFVDVDATQPGAGDLSSYAGRLFQIASVTADSSASTLTVTFVPGVEGTPPFITSILPNIPSISNFDIKFDGRIFALIGDPDIAREASNGSTMFNLDNDNRTAFFNADSSGIARKYASHYHTDVTTELVVHDKDDAGFDLIRIGINTAPVTQTIIYDEAEADRQSFQLNKNNTFITFTSGLTTERVAEFSTGGRPVQGNIVTVTGGPPLPAPETALSPVIDITGFRITNGQAFITVSSFTGIQFTDFIIITLLDGTTTGATIANLAPGTMEIAVFPLVAGTTFENGDTITSIFRPGVEADSDGVTFRGVNYICNLSDADTNPNNQRWAVSIEPKFSDEVRTGLAMSNLVHELETDFGDLYTFSAVPGADGTPAVNYVGKNKTDADNFESTPINNAAPGDRVSVDSSAYIPGVNPDDVDGIEFKTFAQLVSRLREARANFPDLSFTVNDTGGVITIGTDTDNTKSFTVTVPTLSPPVFSNLVTADGLTDLEVTNGTFRTLRNHPDIVFDLDGNAVFAAPFFGSGG